MKRNKFSLSNYKLLTADMGNLVPINLTEVLPGDSIQQATSALIRMSPLLAPVMHPVEVRIHHWFVPTRLIWDDFEKFITGGPDNDDATVPPYVELQNAKSTLADYLGVPVPDVDPNTIMTVSALPFRAYHTIWNEYYRDQDLQTEQTVLKTSGEDNTVYNYLKRICWEKDYFTSARPWTQKGDDITLSLGQTADVTGTITDPARDLGIKTATMGQGFDRGFGTINGGAYVDGIVGGEGNAYIHHPAGAITHDLEADLSTATSVTINQLREAFALQRYAEARAKYGSRYTEYLRYLGVNSSDARLNRPEYLGGGKQTIQFSEVLQTGGDSSGDATGVGNMAGHGIAAMRSNRYRRFFEEHGYILSLMSVKPRTIYTQGISKVWTRQVKEDYYQKELEQIGQAEIKKKEIYVESADPEEVFGYQDRYDEYRRQESTAHGDFKDTLNHWHMARIFASEPSLNSDFVTCTPTKRIHAVTDEDQMWIMVNNSIQARRAIGGNR